MPIAAIDVAQTREVPAWHDEHMHGRLGMEITEGDVVLALGDELRTELAARDAAEDTVRNDWVSHLFTRSRRFGDGSVVRSGFLQPRRSRRTTIVRVCQNSPRSKPSGAP
jgi:hypothetical protein